MAEKKVDLKASAKESKKKTSSLIAEFKAFITRGNVVDLAVGVIIGGAFSAIVTAMVNILLSLCTWGVPGGLAGLVTVLPPFNGNAAQAGIAGIGQSFAASDLTTMTQTYAAANGVANLQPTDATYRQWQTALLGKYTLKGGAYYFNGAALIDWGAFINAIISFLVIALVLFIIMKVVAAAKAKQDEMKAALQEKYYEQHPEERPAPVVPGVPAPTEMDVLIQIRDELKKANGEKAAGK
jgi:large-conductance mechanosensitive channel